MEYMYIYREYEDGFPEPEKRECTLQKLTIWSYMLNSHRDQYEFTVRMAKHVGYSTTRKKDTMDILDIISSPVPPHWLVIHDSLN